MGDSKQRIVWLDWLRVAACLMVMIVHSTEPFYLGGEGTLVLSRGDVLWAAGIDSFVRACVPLFLIASSFLLFPVQQPTGAFLRRRAVRILPPLILWTLVYAFVWGEPVQNLKDLLLNFNLAAGHLWFVYMLIGVYLIMPLLSPWAEKVSRRELRAWILLWAATTLIPLVRDWAATEPLAMTIGPGGMKRQALFPLWGEASWNTYGVFYYVSGMIGYLLIGLWFRRFARPLSWKQTLGTALPLFAAGFAITAGGFLRRVWITTGGTFPVEGPIDLAIGWETTWCYDTPGVAMMAVAWILLFRKITADGGFYRRILRPVSEASYGMYLAHMLVLVLFSGWFRALAWPTPVTILATALCTFITVAIAAVLIRRIPKAGRWIAG